VCHSINFRDHTIQPYVVPYIGRVRNATDSDTEWVCKSIWENPLRRDHLHSGPWQTRINYGLNETLVSSKLSSYDFF
jgi:hypothetical protein